jgi:hypothetical protein
MSSKPEIGMYVILGLVVVNLILTIYCHSRSQEDYRRGTSVAATSTPTQGQTFKVATMAPTTRPPINTFDKDAATNKSVASMQDPNRAILVSIGR